MESTSEAMKIHVSQTTKDILSENFVLTERGEVTVKGKGKMNQIFRIYLRKSNPFFSYE